MAELEARLSPRWSGVRGAGATRLAGRRHFAPWRASARRHRSGPAGRGRTTWGPTASGRREAVDRRIERRSRCPHCGGALAPETDEILEQTLIEAPPVRPRDPPRRTATCAAAAAGASTHPLQVSTAGGAAAPAVRALALAASLNKGLGLTMRKTCAVLRDLVGIGLSPGGSPKRSPAWPGGSPHL